MEQIVQRTTSGHVCHMEGSPCMMIIARAATHDYMTLMVPLAVIKEMKESCIDRKVDVVYLTKDIPENIFDKGRRHREVVSISLLK